MKPSDWTEADRAVRLEEIGHEYVEKVGDLPECGEHCRRVVTCTVCQRHKSPVGRDVAAEASGGYCEHECPGNRMEPYPGHLWPNESTWECLDCKPYRGPFDTLRECQDACLEREIEARRGEDGAT